MAPIIFSFPSRLKPLHTMYFSEFAYLLVCGFIIYTLLYKQDNKYKTSIIVVENVSNTFNIKLPPFACIDNAYTTWAIISFVATCS